MLTIYSSDHSLHHGVELKDGAISESFEKPLRAETVLARVKATALGDVISPKSHAPSSYVGAHSQRYVDFLAGASAVLELARQIDHIASFTRLEP